MTYARFEDLPVWKAAIELGVKVYALVAHSGFARKGDMVNQLQRASLSISNNVAEGFERGTTPELLMFLYIARGSAGEVRSMLRFALRLPTLENLTFEISNLIEEAEGCSRQLRGWADSLQNSEIKGQRHLNEEVRSAFEGKRRADAFLEKLQKMTPHLKRDGEQEMER